MTDSDELLAYYAKDGEPDSWRSSLYPDLDGLLENLGEESPVFIAMKQTGEDFFRARMIVRELVESGTTSRDDISDALADEVCEAMSSFARSPSSRFYNIRFASHDVIQQCYMKRGPVKFADLPWTDSQYNAVVTYAFQLHFTSLTYQGDDKEGMQRLVISAMEACLEARPDDARMHVLFGNWLMVNQCLNDAQEYLGKALRLDEGTCFGAHYTLANLLSNYIPSPERVNQLNMFEQFQARITVQKAQHHLEKYLEVAPTGHWHVHRASALLIHTNCKLAANGPESLESVEKRTPGFAAEQIALFDRCAGALRIFSKCYGREQSDFKSIYKGAASIVAKFHELGIAGDAEMPECEYICGNPTCSKTSDASSTPLKSCARCSSVRYCSKPCQTAHWKVHKKDCKRLKKEYEERKRAHKMKRFDVKMSQLGDDSELFGD